MAAIGGLGARCGEKIASGGRGEDEELRVRRESAGWGMGDGGLPVNFPLGKGPKRKRTESDEGRQDGEGRRRN